MRALFILKHCSLCPYIIDAVNLINMHLPLGERISIIDIFSNDPRLKFLEEYNGNPDRMYWGTPTLVIDIPVMEKKFGVYRKGFKRIVLNGASTLRHMKEVLRLLLEVY